MPPVSPFTHYSLDLITKLPPTGPLQHDAVLVVVDHANQVDDLRLNAHGTQMVDEDVAQVAQDDELQGGCGVAQDDEQQGRRGRSMCA